MYERFISSSMLTGTRDWVSDMGGAWSWSCAGSCRLDVEVLHVERVVLDELAARLDLVAHQRREHQVGLGVVLGLDLEERPLRGVHGRFPEGVRVHLAETLVAVDVEALLAGGDEELDQRVEIVDR